MNIIRRPALKTYAESFRDWGRDCWCPSWVDNTCGKPSGWNLGELPPGFTTLVMARRRGSLSPSRLDQSLNTLPRQASLAFVGLAGLAMSK